MPVSLMIAATNCGKSLSTNCWPETLTAMRATGSPSSTHSLAWRQAVRSTHSPIGRIRPVSSATGMNSAGGTTPNSSLVQRSSASMPETPPRAHVELRLIMQSEFAALQRAAQLRLQGKAMQRRVVHRGIEEREHAGALALGEIHGEVRIAQQGIDVHAVRRVHRHADARRDHQGMQREAHRLLQLGDEPRRHRRRILRGRVCPAASR